MSHIRLADPLDHEAVRKVHMAAFPDAENRVIADLAVALLATRSQPATISLLAETEGRVVGHIAFSPVTANTDQPWSGYILAPLAVEPAFQKRRIGSALINDGLRRLSSLGVNTVLVYGDPDYYARFGFDAATASGYTPPYALQYPFGWLALALDDRAAATSPVRIHCVDALNDPTLW